MAAGPHSTKKEPRHTSLMVDSSLGQRTWLYVSRSIARASAPASRLSPAALAGIKIQATTMAWRGVQ